MKLYISFLRSFLPSSYAVLVNLWYIKYGSPSQIAENSNLASPIQPIQRHKNSPIHYIGHSNRLKFNYPRIKMNAMKLFGSLSILYASVWTCLAIQPNATIPVNIGVVLDANTWIGKLGLSCIRMALSDFYASHGYYKTRLVLNIKDSKEEVIAAASAGKIVFI